MYHVNLPPAGTNDFYDVKKVLTVTINFPAERAIEPTGGVSAARLHWLYFALADLTAPIVTSVRLATGPAI